jgi:hypothetical protein
VTYQGVDETKNDKGETVAVAEDTLLKAFFKADYKSFDVNTVSIVSLSSEKKLRLPR